MQKKVESGERGKVLVEKVEKVEEEVEIENPFGIEVEDDLEESENVETKIVLGGVNSINKLPEAECAASSKNKSELSIEELMDQMNNL